MEMASQEIDHVLSNYVADELHSPATDNIFLHRSITDPVFMHMSRTLTTRELVLLKQVCKDFANVISEYSLFIALRGGDDSKDVYFPLRLPMHVVHTSRPESLDKDVWDWVGLHHPTGENHTLPSLMHLPAHRMESDRGFRSLLDSSRGLLLFSLKPWGLPVRPEWNCLGSVQAQRWRPLLISNPLTQTWRELPAPDLDGTAEFDGTQWDYHGARAHLVVLDEKESEYKVLLLFRNRICVYISRTHGWSVRTFNERIPWGIRSRRINTHSQGSTDYVDVPCAIVGGKLFYAELEVHGNAMPFERDQDDYDADMLRNGGVRVFEVDEEGGAWKPPVLYALRDFIPTTLHTDISMFEFDIGSYGIGMVECMGGMYALIPAFLNDGMDVSDNIRSMYNLGDRVLCEEITYQHFGFFPIRFYVLQLKGVGLTA